MKNKDIYVIIPRGQGLSTKYAIQCTIAQLLGYNVIIVNPNSNACRGRRANIIEWVDDLPEFTKDFKKPIDTPTK